MAQYYLGNMYSCGRGVHKDEAKADQWFQKSGAQGNAFIQTYLGLAYAEGIGVPKDEVKAVEWYRKAADQGTAVAQNNLGTMYAEGKGVPKDEVQAYAWFNLAAVNNDSDAIKFREILEQKMTLEQKAAAQKLSMELFEKIKKPQA